MTGTVAQECSAVSYILADWKQEHINLPIELQNRIARELREHIIVGCASFQAASMCESNLVATRHAMRALIVYSGSTVGGSADYERYTILLDEAHPIGSLLVTGESESVARDGAALISAKHEEPSIVRVRVGRGALYTTAMVHVLIRRAYIAT